jgi:hypothetical protein
MQMMQEAMLKQLDVPSPPTKCKPPKTAFKIFCDSMRAQIQEQYPDITPSKLAVFLGNKWKTMSDSDKSPYIEKQNKV